MTFQGRFREHILPDQMHILNVSLLVPDMQRYYGGCAGNIAYTSIVAPLGEDGADYPRHIERPGIEHAKVTAAHGTSDGQRLTEVKASRARGL